MKLPERDLRPGAFSCRLRTTGSKKNTYYAAHGKMFPDARARAAIKSIVEDITIAMMLVPPALRNWPMRPPYSVTLIVPMKHRTDLDNALGHPLDCLTKCGVIVDDGHVNAIRVVRREMDYIELTVESV